MAHYARVRLRPRCCDKSLTCITAAHCQLGFPISWSCLFIVGWLARCHARLLCDAWHDCELGDYLRFMLSEVVCLGHQLFYLFLWLSIGFSDLLQNIKPETIKFLLILKNISACIIKIDLTTRNNVRITVFHVIIMPKITSVSFIRAYNTQMPFPINYYLSISDF